MIASGGRPSGGGEAPRNVFKLKIQEILCMSLMTHLKYIYWVITGHYQLITIHYKQYDHRKQRDYHYSI